MNIFQQIWKWLTTRACKLPENENSGGDIIRKYRVETELGVAKAVHATYSYVQTGGVDAVDKMTKKLLDCVLEPLPDTAEAILKAAIETKVRSWVLTATAGLPSEAIVVSRLMVILLELP